MLVHPFAARRLRVTATVPVVLLGLVTLIASMASIASAQQQITYMLEINGQNVPIDGIAFGGVGGNQPESGSATLRMHVANGSSPLEDLAQTGGQSRLLVQFHDPQGNSTVHYEFDDVRFGRIQQVGRGPGMMDTLAITYTSFNVNTPGSFHRRNVGGGHVTRAAGHSHVKRATAPNTIHLIHIKQHKRKQP